MSKEYDPNNPNNIIKPAKQKVRMTTDQLNRFNRELLTSLKHMSVRAHLAFCEIERIDSKNDILKMESGIIDKEHLFYVREALKTGKYDKQREIARINYKK